MIRHWMAAAALTALLPGLACAATPAAKPEAAPSAPAAKPQSDAEVPRIDLPQFKQAFDAKTVAVVDTRSEQAFAIGHIPGAVVWNSDPAQLDAQVARLKATRKAIVTYCT